MNPSFARFILSAQVITPTGMNLDIALSVAKADLGRFNLLEDDGGGQGYTYANADFLKAGTAHQRRIEMITTLASALLIPLTRDLKPLPLLLSVPGSSQDKLNLHNALEQNPALKGISSIKITHEGGASFVHDALQLLDTHDLVLCIAVDSLFENIPLLIADSILFSKDNPWGLIPSEGGAGVIFVKKNMVDTLALSPLAKVEYFDIERGAIDRRAMMRLVRRASKSVPFFGPVYSNMTNSRAQTEEYGFALGARGALFTHPEEPYLINGLWGALGGGSALALLSVFVAEHTDPTPGSLLMFEPNGDRAMLILSRCL